MGKKGLRKQRILVGDTLWMKDIGKICQDIHSPFDSAFATQEMSNSMIVLNELIYREFREDVKRIQKYFFTNFETDVSYAETLLGRPLRDTKEAVALSAKTILENDPYFSDLEKSQGGVMIFVSFLAILVGFGCILINDYITTTDQDVLTWQCSTCPDVELCRNPLHVFSGITIGTLVFLFFTDFIIYGLCPQEYKLK